MMSEGRPVFRNSLDECSPGPRVATIGMFDGVHLGHQFLLETTVARAWASGVPSVVVTFEPPPALVLRPDLFSGRICSPAEKLKRIAMTGVDEIVTVRFDLELAALSPEAFMKQVMERLSP